MQQAIIFNKNLYTLNDAKKFIKKHDLKPIKEVHQTKNYYRFWLSEPDPIKFWYVTKTIAKGIKIIIGYKI